MAALHNSPGTGSLDGQDPVPVVAEGPLPRSLVNSQVPCISSEVLLGGANEVHIQHRGSLYRLKQTALGKLILTK